ncbi:hypothetical protein C9374_007907 [Naegleria lovaniensis]|uniref:F-box domain-containing protein n=1 Tax=Naegleria lovaniensis TaxID=51637 RepID=A0AA88GG44_NAELO|nr:uncharacterized protein C9374_007907 [Naegleria lovaniensis]KAG2378759.1 hypothetical protein C9374_007907 [Naegleria lovaniensis]
MSKRSIKESLSLSDHVERKNRKIVTENKQEISQDVLVNVLFRFFDYKWLFQTASLVCREWYELAKKSQFKLNIVLSKNNHQPFVNCCACGRLESITEFVVRELTWKILQEICSFNISFKFLEVLDLSHNRIGDDGVQILSNHCKVFETVKILNLSSNKISHKGAQLLKEATFTRLTHLDLSMNPIGNEGCTHIANMAFGPSLLKLKLYDCNISDIGIKNLLNSTNLNSLTWLNLRFNKIGLEGIQYLENNGHIMSNLTKLNLRFSLQPSSKDYIKKSSLFTKCQVKM